MENNVAYIVWIQDDNGNEIRLLTDDIPSNAVRVVIDIALPANDPMAIALRPQTVRELVRTLDGDRDQIASHNGMIFQLTRSSINRG